MFSVANFAPVFRHTHLSNSTKKVLYSSNSSRSIRNLCSLIFNRSRSSCCQYNNTVPFIPTRESHHVNINSCRNSILSNSTSFLKTSLSSSPLMVIARSIVTSAVIKADAEMVDVTFVRSDGSKVTTKGKIGDNLLDVVVNNSVDLDGFGACEGTLACSTCHLVFKQEDFDKIQEKLTDEEMDMLDMAYGLTDTSRLGCQVCLTKELAGVEVVVPAGVNDARS